MQQPRTPEPGERIPKSDLNGQASRLSSEIHASGQWRTVFNHSRPESVLVDHEVWQPVQALLDQPGGWERLLACAHEGAPRSAA